MKHVLMTGLFAVVFAIVLFPSCTQEEAQIIDLTNSTMFGVKGNSHDSTDLAQFTVLNSTRSVYIKFKSDAETYYGISMNKVNNISYGLTYYSTFKNNVYYKIAWNDTNSSFSFSRLK
jgi:hypothetical protein